MSHSSEDPNQHPSPMPTPVITTNRLEAFSDGVFAIVITLLVLDIRLDPATAGQPLAARLWAIWPKMSAYAITFIIVGIYWVGHHGLFHLVKRVNKTLMWLNLCLLLCISFLPFPASVMGINPLDPTAIRFYSANLILIGCGFAAIWYYATREHRLVAKDLDPLLNRILWKRVIIAPSIYLLAFLMSWVDPRISLALFPIVPLIYIPSNRFDPRHFKA